MQNLTIDIILNALNEHIIAMGVPTDAELGLDFPSTYGETIVDDFVYSIYEAASPTDDGYELFENDEIYDRQYKLMQEISNSVDETALLRNKISLDYLRLANDFVAYATDRMAGGG